MALTGKILVYWIGSLLWETVAYKSWLHMEVQFIPSLLQLLIPPIMQFFLNPSTNWRLLTTLLFDEKMLYETFLTLGLFRLLFCRTCDQAVLYLFFLGGYPCDTEAQKWWTAIWFSRPHFNQRGLCGCHGFLLIFLIFANYKAFSTKELILSKEIT